MASFEVDPGSVPAQKHVGTSRGGGKGRPRASEWNSSLSAIDLARLMLVLDQFVVPHIVAAHHRVHRLPLSQAVDD